MTIPAAYYSEWDKRSAAWLRELIKRGLIAHGDVDERSIIDVRADDLRGYTQCHFFAGIGVWSHSLRLAGWGDDRPVWTASLPCQPFSAAGERLGAKDERNLLEVWLRLAEECRPPVCIGEQVEPAIGLNWLDALFIRFEQADYACGAAVFPAASVGAPHRRERLYWCAVAESDNAKRWAEGSRWNYAIRAHAGWEKSTGDAEGRGPACELADADRGRLQQCDTGQWAISKPDAQRNAGLLGDAFGTGLQGFGGDGDDGHQPGRVGAEQAGSVAPAGPVNGFWSDAEWLACTDGKARATGPGISPLVHAKLRGCESGQVRESGKGTEPQCAVDTGQQITGATQPGAFPLAHGAAARVVRLRGYGNAIVAPQAAEFIRAFLDVTGGGHV